MSTKTIAVDTRVYDRLAGAKKSGESFSKTIDRLLDEVGASHTGRRILRLLPSFPSLSEAEADTFLQVISENRETEAWDDRSRQESRPEDRSRAGA